MRHECHVPGCHVAVPRRMLMCRAHWFRVPPALRDRVWATYQSGQELGRVRPSREYLLAARAAIQSVASSQGDLFQGRP